MTAPPLTYEIREKQIGHVLVNTTTDKPWSQYFCCMITSTRDFIRERLTEVMAEPVEEVAAE